MGASPWVPAGVLGWAKANRNVKFDASPSSISDMYLRCFIENKYSTEENRKFAYDKPQILKMFCPLGFLLSSPG